MSAGMMSAATEPKPSADLSLLAPGFRDQVEPALEECNAKGHDVYVYEAQRSNELQAIYYARGRTVKPPFKTVTNARSNLYSWHGFGLAVDVIHRTMLWSAPQIWWVEVGSIFKKHGLLSGGDWVGVDLPHMYFGTLRKSPSDRARELLTRGGLEAVWREVGALRLVTAPPRPVVRLLTKGVKGRDVLAWQNVLVDGGWMSAAQRATAPGTFGPATDRATRMAQAARGLHADGDVGADTRKAFG